MEQEFKATVETLKLNDFREFQYINVTEGLSPLCRHLLNNTDKGFILLGGTGTGKTTSLTEVSTYLESRNMSTSRDYTGNTLFNSIINEYSGDINTLGEVCLRLGSIIIDDLGTEPVEYSEYRNTIKPIADLLNYIYDNRAKNPKFRLFITSNLKIELLIKKYSKITIDRVLEMCMPVSVKTKNFRAENQEDLSKILKK